MSYYAIRLNADQSIGIFGFLNAKTTLTWNDILWFSTITLPLCVSKGICVRKLYNMQPDINEWIRNKKVFIQDIEFLKEWHPNPFQHFRCTIGDLVLHRKYITPNVLIDAGVTFDMLRENYGLTPDLMALLKYNVSEWIALGLTEEFLMEHIAQSPLYSKIFGMLSTQDVVTQIRRSPKKR